MVLGQEFPGQATQLKADYDAALASVSAGDAAKVDGIAVGDAAAKALLAARAKDGRNEMTAPYTPGNGPGRYVPTPPAKRPPILPGLAKVKPFTFDSPSKFRQEPLTPLASAEWANDYDEVKQYGAKTSEARSPEQTATVQFWAARSDEILPPSIRMTSTGLGLGLADAARFQAMAFTAMADALVATWDGKYHYNFWRPVTAIPAGETDGNKKTEPDAAWEPLLVTPPHPEYPCAHCEVTAATMTAVTTAFGKPDLEFVIQNPKTKEVRRYPKVDAAIEEVSNARVWGGIHYRTSAMRGGAAGHPHFS